jgi:hypothetical protein
MANARPKQPDSEKGRQVREQYLALAQTALKNLAIDYPSLYQQYVRDLQGAQGLDQEIAGLALKAGQPPRSVIQLLAQGPFTQAQVATLTPEEKQAALHRLLQYAQGVVETAQRQRFVDYANGVTGKVWNYPDLYQASIGSDLAAIQLDQKVAAAALKAGETTEEIVALLQQSPYSRFQRDVKQVSPATLEQYARGTVAQVQEIQSMRPAAKERISKSVQGLEQ